MIEGGPAEKALEECDWSGFCWPSFNLADLVDSISMEHRVYKSDVIRWIAWARDCSEKTVERKYYSDGGGGRPTFREIQREERQVEAAKKEQEREREREAKPKWVKMGHGRYSVLAGTEEIHLKDEASLPYRCFDDRIDVLLNL